MYEVQTKELVLFLSDVRDLLKRESPQQVQFVASLRSFGIPLITAEIIRSCAQCKAPVENLVPLRSELDRTSAHDYSTSERWIAWCPTLSTLVLKSTIMFASRTHGHHFRERWQTTYRLLGDDELWDLLSANPDAVEAGLANRANPGI